jgi:hypothetical protein
MGKHGVEIIEAAKRSRDGAVDNKTIKGVLVSYLASLKEVGPFYIHCIGALDGIAGLLR